MNLPRFRQLCQGNFLDIIFSCPYELHELCLLYTSSIFGGQHDLAAKETVGLIVQGRQRAVSEAEETLSLIHI